MDLSALLSFVPAKYLVYVITAIGICGIISTALPAPSTTKGLYYGIYQTVNWIALNFWHAKNLSAPESKNIVGGPGAISAPQISVSSVPAPPKGTTP